MIVVDDPDDWPLEIDGVRVVTGERYIADPEFQSTDPRQLKLFNCCRSYRYQSTGYYVSLLAEARGHKPLPGVTTIQDLKNRSILRIGAEDLDDLIQRSLKRIKSDELTLSIYFGRNHAKRYDALARRLHQLFPAPFLRARFARNESSGRWLLAWVSPIAMSSIRDEHWPFVEEAARSFFAGKMPHRNRRRFRYDLALLTDPDAAEPPSDELALKKFTRAAEALGMRVERITREDGGRLSEFDALFIRETTSVQHHTYRFARRAAAEGLVVIDDPTSIFRCCNKVYLAELLARHEIAAPRTMICNRRNLGKVAATLGFPCILKQPDSSFSQGVTKVSSEEELRATAAALFERSDLIVAQENVPTSFDWRIGVLDRQPLYAARYHMAKDHWQVIQRDGNGKAVGLGSVDTLAIADVPPAVVRTALKAANLIGDGLYGVDLKQVGKRVLVIEVNDNPNLDAGMEDRVLGSALYQRIAEVFLRRLERLRLPAAMKVGK